MSYTALSAVATGMAIASAWGMQVKTDLEETGPAKVTTAGDLVYATGANALARLGIGATESLLRSTGSAPSWFAKGADGAFLGVAAGALAWGSPSAAGSAGGSLAGTYPNPTLAVPYCRVYKSADQSIPNNTNTLLTFDLEVTDPSGMHSNSSNTSRITAARAGLMLAHASIRWTGNSTSYRKGFLLVNGGGVADQQMMGQVSDFGMEIACLVAVAAGDYLEAQAFQVSGGALNVIGNGLYTILEAVIL